MGQRVRSHFIEKYHTIQIILRDQNLDIKQWVITTLLPIITTSPHR